MEKTEAALAGAGQKTNDDRKQYSIAHGSLYKLLFSEAVL